MFSGAWAPQKSAPAVGLKMFSCLHLIASKCCNSLMCCMTLCKKVKIDKTVKSLLKEEERFGLKKYSTYKNFANKIYKMRSNVVKNLDRLKKDNKVIVGYGAPAKATTALNFFGINNQIDFIVEDNKLKHSKFIPGVKIPIFSKTKIKSKLPLILVLAWNFFDDIKKNNQNLSKKFINIKDLENN